MPRSILQRSLPYEKVERFFEYAYGCPCWRFFGEQRVRCLGFLRASRAIRRTVCPVVHEHFVLRRPYPFGACDLPCDKSRPQTQKGSIMYLATPTQTAGVVFLKILSDKMQERKVSQNRATVFTFRQFCGILYTVRQDKEI